MGDHPRINHDAVNNLISLSGAAEAEAQSLDPGPSFEQLCDERQERTFSTMQSIDAVVAKETLPDCTQETEDGRRLKAAVVIQSHYRGYIDRCKYLELLYDVYEKEEEERKQRAYQQVEEGELLVANHKLEIDIEDAETAARNKQRRYENNIITIQRAWRSYKRKHRQSKSLQKKQDISGNGEEPASPSSRRKTDLLSRAQEFANLKKQYDGALPYNAHRATLLSDSSSSEGSTLSSPEHTSYKSTRSSNPFNKSSLNKELTLPQLDWSQLESSIGQSTSSRSSSLSTRLIKDSHREDVRKRLAMNTPADGSYGEVYTRPINKTFRGQNTTMELYMNDCNDEASSVKPSAKTETDLVSRQLRLQQEATLAYSQAGPIAKKIIAVEKLAEEPSQIARMLGISTFLSQGEVTLTKRRLESLTLAQLQVVYNAMQNEIERLNEELVEIVVSRDELHMQQDSILVNVEDLQRRIEEQSKKHQKRLEAKESKKASISKQSQPRSAASRMGRLFGLGKT